MITKKTLTRQSIDELAKVCPPVIGSDSNRIFGGARYYCESGSLGRYGSSDEMRVISSIPSEAKESGTWPDWKLNNLPGSSGIEEASNFIKSYAISQIASENGYYNVSAKNLGDASIWGQYHYSSDGSGSVDEVIINTQFFSSFSRVVDLEVVMYHEMVHRDQRQNTSITGNVSGPEGGFTNDEAEAFYKAWLYAKEKEASSGMIAEMYKRYAQEQF